MREDAAVADADDDERQQHPDHDEEHGVVVGVGPVPQTLLVPTTPQSNQDGPASKHMDVNNLARIVTQPRPGRRSNSRPLDRKSDALPLRYTTPPRDTSETGKVTSHKAKVVTIKTTAKVKAMTNEAKAKAQHT